MLDPQTCEDCRAKHGKVYAITETPDPQPPLHFYCRCTIEAMRAVKAGMASCEYENGADCWLLNNGILPEYYISIDEIIQSGWSNGKSPAKYAPGKMITRGVYRNEDLRLPDAPGRIWYEADLNYYYGKRNGHQILWSNDGLIFVTYNHYETFIEVIGG